MNHPNVWEYTGEHWVATTPTDPEGDGSPVLLLGPALSYDALRGVTVLFGGGQQDFSISDTMAMVSEMLKSCCPPPNNTVTPRRAS